MTTALPLTRRAFLVRTAATFAGATGFAAAGRTRAFPVKAAQVRGLAVNCCGDIAIAADRAILFYDTDGKLDRTVPMPASARSIAWDGKTWFVALKDQVARVKDDGAIELLGAPFGSRESALTGLAVADSGEIFVADSGERVVWRLDAAGKVLGKIEGFAVPRAFFPIAWRDGKLLVAEPGRHQVQTYSRDGKLIARWGERSRELAGFGGCCNPVSLAAQPDGTIITAERGQPRVKAFDAGGKFARLLAGPEQFTASVAEDAELFGCEGGIIDVAAAPDGDVILLDRTARKIRVLA